MRAFFHAIILVSVFTGILLISIFLIDLVKKFRVNKAQRAKKLNDAARILKRNEIFFSELIDKLRTNDILWMEVLRDDNHSRMLIQKSPISQQLNVSVLSGSKNNTTEAPDAMENLSDNSKEDRYAIAIDSLDEVYQLFRKQFNSGAEVSLKFKY